MPVPSHSLRITLRFSSSRPSLLVVVFHPPLFHPPTFPTSGPLCSFLCPRCSLPRSRRSPLMLHCRLLVYPMPSAISSFVSFRLSVCVAVFVLLRLCPSLSRVSSRSSGLFTSCDLYLSHLVLCALRTASLFRLHGLSYLSLCRCVSPCLSSLVSCSLYPRLHPVLSPLTVVLIRLPLTFT